MRSQKILLKSSLEGISKVEEKVILNDLNTAVKYSLIPQGHFGCDNIIFITSDICMINIKKNK